MKKQTTDLSAYEHVTHTFDPVYDKNSTILILGSMPSVKSREQQFYYGHPQNRFWKVISAVFGETEPDTIAEKKEFLLRNNVALWDVIASCDIIGSSDSSIKNVKGNDMNVILSAADIQTIFLNGGKAHELFMKYCVKYVHEGKPTLVKLPSTSPANAVWSLEGLTNTWRDAISILGEGVSVQNGV
ncbi:MAG: DNA-deoxyinosine glycosylase [Lachnospiraceae bacterium]|nr:DNA-deoxyinosine glycosylase [Lachnospiraceae bacterium]